MKINYLLSLSALLISNLIALDARATDKKELEVKGLEAKTKENYIEKVAIDDQLIEKKAQKTPEIPTNSVYYSSQALSNLLTSVERKESKLAYQVRLSLALEEKKTSYDFPLSDNSSWKISLGSTKGVTGAVLTHSTKYDDMGDLPAIFFRAGYSLFSPFSSNNKK